MKAFLGTNYVMAVNQLPNISIYWDCDHFIRNNGIQNIFTRGRYKEILQNLRFADNSKQDQTRKGYTIRPITDRLNKSFQESYSNEPKESIDEHITKFKGRSSWDNIWKWNQLNGVLNGGLDVRGQMVICMNLIYIYEKSKCRG